jgi:hypothetical protein
VSSSITYTTTLEVRRETAQYLARLLAAHRLAVGTRRGRRALGPFKQAVLVLRWFLDGTRMRQLAADNRIGKSTAYDYLHEGIDVLRCVLAERASPGPPRRRSRSRRRAPPRMFYARPRVVPPSLDLLIVTAGGPGRGPLTRPAQAFHQVPQPLIRCR